MNSTICEAVRARKLLMFAYANDARMVEVYCGVGREAATGQE
jgi:hypothetical protein